MTLMEETDDTTHGGDGGERSWRRQVMTFMEETGDDIHGGDR